MLRKGDHAPDFTLETADGESFTLSKALQETERILLVFLRHLG